MSDIFTPLKRRQIMQAVRRSGTAPETEMARQLRLLGVKFAANAHRLPGKPDFCLKSARLVVFVHGCFWHGHAKCRKGLTLTSTRRQYWQMRIAKNRRRDCRVAKALRAMGWRVFTVWECELRRKGIPRRLLTALGLTNRGHSDTTGSSPKGKGLSTTGPAAGHQPPSRRTRR